MHSKVWAPFGYWDFLVVAVLVQKTSLFLCTIDGASFHSWETAAEEVRSGGAEQSKSGRPL